ADPFVSERNGVGIRTSTGMPCSLLDEVRSHARGRRMVVNGSLHTVPRRKDEHLDYLHRARGQVNGTGALRGLDYDRLSCVWRRRFLSPCSAPPRRRSAPDRSDARLSPTTTIQASSTACTTSSSADGRRGPGIPAGGPDTRSSSSIRRASP